MAEVSPAGGWMGGVTAVCMFKLAGARDREQASFRRFSYACGAIRAHNCSNNYIMIFWLANNPDGRGISLRLPAHIALWRVNEQQCEQSATSLLSWFRLEKLPPGNSPQIFPNSKSNHYERRAAFSAPRRRQTCICVLSKCPRDYRPVCVIFSSSVAHTIMTSVYLVFS